MSLRRRSTIQRPPPQRVRINQNIKAPEVRLIAEDGQQVGVMSIKDALAHAAKAHLDLVEVAPQANPPVCRIMDYGKYRYEQEQKAKRARKHQANLVIKEMKMRPKIDVHDYETKKKHVVRFLEAGHKVKMTIMFRGREMTHTELGRKLLERLAADVEHLATVESPPKQDGRNMLMMLAPHKEFVEAAVELRHQDDDKHRARYAEEELPAPEVASEETPEAPADQTEMATEEEVAPAAAEAGSKETG